MRVSQPPPPPRLHPAQSLCRCRATLPPAGAPGGARGCRPRWPAPPGNAPPAPPTMSTYAHVPQRWSWCNAPTRVGQRGGLCRLIFSHLLHWDIVGLRLPDCHLLLMLRRQSIPESFRTRGGHGGSGVERRKGPEENECRYGRGCSLYSG